ncbi:MAG: PHP domain-containing protein [Alphaproteobacteria bacterium]|nr:PHP domain-containing protein [Alphaproteobacteria bacterium]
MILLAGALAQTTLTLDGTVTEGGSEFVLVPFDVPAGTAEIAVSHASLTGSVLDWGLSGPDGAMHGWGGGNGEDAWITATAASRSYLPGVEVGTWNVVIGKARLEQADNPYTLSVTLHETAVHTDAQPREPWAEPAPIEVGARWYAGDFHVHSRESGDAAATFDQIADLARERGLDFVVITDHNTTSTLDLLVDAQRRNPDVLFVPGMEYTTYHGHMNAIGNTALLDHRLGVGDATVDRAIDDVHGVGGLVSINHPELDLGGLCIGCAWEHDVDPASLDGVEIQTGGLLPVGGLFSDASIAFWESMTSASHMPAALGGSDDHKAGIDLGFQGSPIGDPTTLVWAESLSVQGILDGVRAGRTVVKLQGPADPMVELVATDVGFEATVTGTASFVRFVVDGEPQVLEPVTSDPFTHAITLQPMGQVVRAEALIGGDRHTVTSHVLNARAIPPEEEGTCGCAATVPSAPWALLSRR